MSNAAAATLTLAVLGLAGILPVLSLVGARLVALPLSPLIGALIGALSGACCIAIAGSLLMWFIIWSCVAAAVAGVLFAVRPRARQRLRPDLRRELRPTVLAGAVVIVAAAVWALRTVGTPNIGFDTRAIWMLHARWLSYGHALAFSDIRNHFFVVSHPTYPPLISASMALTWLISGNGSDRVAVITVTLLNGCALSIAGWGVVEVARRAIDRLRGPRWRMRTVMAVGVVVGALVMLVAGGVLGTFATNGYADPLWSLCAVSAVLFGLVLEPTSSDLAVVAILLGVTGLTKVEGMAVAVILLLVIAVRRQLRRPAPRWLALRPLLAVGTGVVLLLGWEMLTVVLGIPTDPSIGGKKDGSLWSRAVSTWDQAVPHLHVVGLAALIGLAGFVVLRSLRGRIGVGNDLWAWVAVAVAIGVLGGAYVLGAGDVELWLATSVNRTTIFVALMAWWILAIWALCATTAALE
jgi:hypothetical protein